MYCIPTISPAAQLPVAGEAGAAARSRSRERAGERIFGPRFLSRATVINGVFHSLLLLLTSSPSRNSPLRVPGRYNFFAEPIKIDQGTFPFPPGLLPFLLPPVFLFLCFPHLSPFHPQLCALLFRYLFLFSLRQFCTVPFRWPRGGIRCYYFLGGVCVSLYTPCIHKRTYKRTVEFRPFLSIYNPFTIRWLLLFFSFIRHAFLLQSTVCRVGPSEYRRRGAEG